MTNKNKVWAMSFEELLTTDFPTREWTVSEVLPPGLTVLGGAPKAGKSFLALQLAGAVAQGTPFLGRSTKQGKVLYFALEDIPERLQSRAFQQDWDLSASGDVATYTMIQKHLSGRRFSEFLLDEVDWAEYSLIIIDTLSRMIELEGIPYNPDKNHDMTRLLSPVQAKALETRTSVLILDHHGKMVGTEGRSRDPMKDVMGSVAKVAVADAAWGLYRDPSNGTGTLLTRSRDLPDEVWTLQFDPDTLAWVLADPEAVKPTEPEPNPKETNVTEKDRELLNVVQALGPMTRYGVSKALGRKPGPVYRQIAKLLELGLLTERDGKYTSNPGPETQTQVPEPEESTREETSVEVSLVEAPETQVPVVPQAGDPVPAETKPETIPPEPEPELEMEVRMIDTSAVKDVEKICAEMTDKYPANAWDIYVAIRDLGPLTLEEIEYVTGESRFYIGYICLQLVQKGILLRGQYVDEFWGPVPEDPADLPAAREAMGRKWQELELKKRRKDVQQTNEKFRGQTWYSEVPLPTNVLPFPENFVVPPW